MTMKYLGHRVGTILGKGSEYNHLKMVVAFSERDKAPKLGSFLIVEESDFMRRKLLCRVESMSYGDFQTTLGERQRALVEKYLREQAGYDRELSEEEKRGLFFRQYDILVLGEIDLTNTKIKSEYRILPELSSKCRYPTFEELQLIVSAGIDDPDDAVTVGNLSVGDRKYEQIHVAFEPRKFENRRSAIFARTGYGKSNLCKVVVALAALTSSAGILVLDIDGEYTFGTRSSDGAYVPGLADINALKQHLVAYTDRTDVISKYQDVPIKPFINLKELRTWQISNILGDQYKVIEDMRNWDSSKVNDWNQLVTDIREANNDYQRITDCIKVFAEKHINANQRSAFRREIRPLFELDSPDAGNFITEIPYHLQMGRVVVLDLSLMPINQGIQLSAAVLNEIFRRNVHGITSGNEIKTIAVFEESQNVLNRKQVDEGSSVFVRWAKEGRKFGLGLIYVTQQPGAVAEEIVSQTDNFFVMHLLNQGDIDALRKANPHYGGVIGKFLSDETIVGNSYIYSSPHQPYIFPSKVFKFSEEFIRKLPNRSYEKSLNLVEMAKFLKQKRVGADPSKELKTVIAHGSYTIYEYLKNKGINHSKMDHDNTYMDYSFARLLLRDLHERGLIGISQFSKNVKRDSIQDETGDEWEELDDEEIPF